MNGATKIEYAADAKQPTLPLDPPRVRDKLNWHTDCDDREASARDEMRRMR